MAQILDVNIATERIVTNIKASLKKEARLLQGYAFNHLGSVGQPTVGASGANNFQKWLTVPSSMPDIAQYAAVTTRDVVVPAGRCYVIENIEFYGSLDFTAQVYIRREVQNSLNGVNGGISLDSMVEGRPKFQSDPSGGKVRLLDSTIVLNPGDAMGVYFWRDRGAGDSGVTPSTNTRGMRWMFNIEGSDITCDPNYGAKKTIMVIGDSLGGVTSDSGSLMLGKNGSEYFGLWPYILRSRFQEDGIDTRLVNLSQGGTTAIQWDWWIKQGRIDGIKADILFVSLFMNDSVNDSALPFTATIARNIVNRFLQNNPKSSVVFLQIPQTDTRDQTRLTNYRNALSAAVSGMISDDLPVIISPTDTSYDYSTGAAYLASEQTPGQRLHANTTVGQKAVAETTYPLVQNLLN